MSRLAFDAWSVAIGLLCFWLGWWQRDRVGRLGACAFGHLWRPIEFIHLPHRFSPDFVTLRTRLMCRRLACSKVKHFDEDMPCDYARENFPPERQKKETGP